jgi:hypothetical protein
MDIGSIPPFLSQPYSQYAKWIDWNWIVSIWKHMSQLQITVEVENMWAPSLLWSNDVTLMEVACQYNFLPQYMKELIQCHIYLQVITLANICTVDGRKLLPEALTGEDLPYRQSTLSWPHQNRPNKPDRAAWRKWSSFL